MIYKQLSKNKFHDEFNGYREDQFSWEALNALFEMMDNSGEDVELDVVGICCEYSELSLEDAIDSYSIECKREIEPGWYIRNASDCYRPAPNNTPPSLMRKVDEGDFFDLEDYLICDEVCCLVESVEGLDKLIDDDCEGTGDYIDPEDAIIEHFSRHCGWFKILSNDCVVFQSS